MGARIALIEKVMFFSLILPLGLVAYQLPTLPTLKVPCFCGCGYLFPVTWHAFLDPNRTASADSDGDDTTHGRATANVRGE